MAFYSKVEYWNERYKWSTDEEVLEECFDWYVPYAVRLSDGTGFAPGVGLREEILGILPKRRSGTKILIVGCGTSTMGEQLYDDGYQDVTCVDFSETCIKRMQHRMQLDELTLSDTDGRPPRRGAVRREGLQYLCVDCVDLNQRLPSTAFDVVIDKGMLDATMCDSEPTAVYDRMARILENIYELLKQGGSLVHVTPSRETGGPRGVIFHNPVLPWSSISAAKLDLSLSSMPRSPETSDGAAKASSSPAPSTSFYEKPYWLYQLVK